MAPPGHTVAAVLLFFTQGPSVGPARVRTVRSPFALMLSRRRFSTTYEGPDLVFTPAGFPSIVGTQSARATFVRVR
jgi:hypothetical protein